MRFKVEGNGDCEKVIDEVFYSFFDVVNFDGFDYEFTYEIKDLDDLSLYMQDFIEDEYGELDFGRFKVDVRGLIRIENGIAEVRINDLNTYHMFKADFKYFKMDSETEGKQWDRIKEKLEVRSDIVLLDKK